MSFRWPRPVARGSALGLFSPSSPGPVKYPERYRRSVTALRALGYEIVEGSSSRGRRGYRSGLPEERAEDLHELVADDRVGAVVATIGGLNTIELLPYLDYDLLAEHAKPICGFSDVSVLLNAGVAHGTSGG